MPDGASWLIVVLTFFVLPVATRPAIRQAFVRLAERTDEWTIARAARKARPDTEQEKLWQWSKRRRLCVALDRIERLIATDSWMSATRQLGNRLAYQQLVDELRRTPDVFPTSLDGSVVDLWAEPLPVRRRSRSSSAARQEARDRWDARDFEAGWSAAPAPAAYSSQGATVEVIEIGWRRR